MDKPLVVKEIRKAIQDKQNSLEEMLAELSLAIAEDTKSSAGDKFETARAMAQQEIDKVQQQLAETKRQLALLSSLAETGAETVNAGNLVETTIGTYFIGVPAGQLTIEGKTVYCISSASPLAQQLIGKRVKESAQSGVGEHEIRAIS